MALVYWFEPGGQVLHVSAECPIVRRGLRASMGVALGPRLVSCDLDAPVAGQENPYPPANLDPCRTCSR